MSDQKPREFWIHETPIGRSFNGRHKLFTASEVAGENPGWVHVIEYSAYQALALRLKEAETEVERLKDTPGGKRLYLTFNELAREREITAMFREALETIEPVIKQVGDEWPESSADSSLANEYLGVTIIISEALVREAEMRKGDVGN